MCIRDRANAEYWFMTTDKSTADVDYTSALARASGTLIVHGGYTNEDCKSLGADFYLNNISELKSILNLFE